MGLQIAGALHAQLKTFVEPKELLKHEMFSAERKDIEKDGPAGNILPRKTAFQRRTREVSSERHLGSQGSDIEKSVVRTLLEVVLKHFESFQGQCNR